MRKRNSNESLSDQLRRLIKAEGSLYRLAEEADIDRSILSRFVAGKRGLTTETIDRLAAVLKLRIVAGR
jgi:plasmid maintenance system antidote protein VapI